MTFYQKYAHWLRELSRIAQRPVRRTRYTWAAYCAGMTAKQFAKEVLK